jgi:FkbM family methyltransferase
VSHAEILIERMLGAPYPLSRLAHRVQRRLTVEWRKRTYIERREIAALAAWTRSEPARAEPFTVHVRMLNGAAVAVRPGTTDAGVLWSTFVGMHHLPPPEIDPRTIRVVWDLGANVGLTMAHYAVRYPLAQVFGVELDPTTAVAARQNLQPWQARCKVIRGAVWREDGEVEYEFESGKEEAARVVAASGPSQHRAPALSLNSLFAEFPRIDFVKFDIEGAEQAVLRDGQAWAGRVRSLKVEVHAPYTVEECIHDLELLGFKARRELTHWACVVGVR